MGGLWESRVITDQGGDEGEEDSRFASKLTGDDLARALSARNASAASLRGGGGGGAGPPPLEAQTD
jgi:hypothetical protein